MIKKIIFIFMLLPSVISISAQKEVYFNTVKPEGIKVESMQGLEISSGYNPLIFFRPSYFTDNTFSVPLNMSYFNEKRIAPSWTLTSRIGLTHSFVNQAQYFYTKDSINVHDSTFYFDKTNIGGYQFAYRLNLNLGIEPRWYLGFKNRYEKGKAKLNSGWYLSLPVTYSAILINTYKSPEHLTYNNVYRDYGNVNISLMLGYRQTISKNWFLEGSLNTIGDFITFSETNNRLFVYSGFIINPVLSLKAAYTFK